MGRELVEPDLSDGCSSAVRIPLNLADAASLSFFRSS